MSGMTKAERTELQSIVRRQFKVLRSEVAQRQVELLADMEAEIAAKYAETDEKWSTLVDGIRMICESAEREVETFVRSSDFENVQPRFGSWMGMHNLPRPEDGRSELRRVATAQIAARAAEAKLSLERQEADILRDLAMGALESDEAHRFLRSIPSVGELIPAARLRELVEGPDA